MLAVALLKTAVVAGVTFWFALVVFHLYPPLVNYLVKLFEAENGCHDRTLHAAKQRRGLQRRSKPGLIILL